MHSSMLHSHRIGAHNSLNVTACTLTHVLAFFMKHLFDRSEVDAFAEVFNEILTGPAGQYVTSSVMSFSPATFATAQTTHQPATIAV